MPIVLSRDAALANFNDVNAILKSCGEKQISKKEMEENDFVKINYSFTADYCGDLPQTLERVKRLADQHGAQAVVKVRMHLLDVLRALDAL